MKPANRDNLKAFLKTASSDMRAQVYHELLTSLLLAHQANIVHCDVRAENCLHFADKWHVVDYDLAERCDETSVEYVVHKDSAQFKESGFGVQKQCQSDDEWFSVL